MTSPVEVVFLFDIAHTLLMSDWAQRSRNPLVAKSARSLKEMAELPKDKSTVSSAFLF
jgi:hypothetical protein